MYTATITNSLRYHDIGALIGMGREEGGGGEGRGKEGARVNKRTLVCMFFSRAEKECAGNVGVAGGNPTCSVTAL